jgi:hypothetical protein
LARAAVEGVKPETRAGKSEADESKKSEEAKSELAFALNRQGLASHRLGDAAAVARHLAESFWGQGALDDALETALKALELGQKTENQDCIANAWRTLGLVASRREGEINVGGRERDAASCFGEGLRVYTSMGPAAERARTLRDWSRHERASGNSEGGARMWREALEIFNSLGMTRELERLPREDVET